MRERPHTDELHSRLGISPNIPQMNPSAHLRLKCFANHVYRHPHLLHRKIIQQDPVHTTHTRFHHLL